MNEIKTNELSCARCHDVIENKKTYLFMSFCSARCIELYCKEHTGHHCSSCGVAFCFVPDDEIKTIDGFKFCSSKCSNNYVYERRGLNLLNAQRQGDF